VAGPVVSSPAFLRSCQVFFTGWECLVGTALAVLFGLLFYQGYFSEIYGIENRFLDRQFVMRGKVPLQDDVVLVSISDKCIAEIGIWPWPREAYAKVLGYLKQAGARVVAFDIMFSEPSTHGAEDDRIFADAVKEAGNVVLPMTFATKVMLNNDLEMERQMLIGRALPDIQAGSVGEGYISLDYDEVNVDGVIRRLFLDREHQGKHYLLFGLECVRKFLNVDVARTPEGLWVGNLLLPAFTRKELTRPERPVSSFLLNYLGGTGHFAEVFFSDLYQGPQAVSNFSTIFRDKIVIIGSRAMGTAEDTKFSPFGAVAGMEIHAHLIQNILSRSFLVRPSPGWSMLLLLVLALTVSWLIWWLPDNAWIAGLLSGLLWVGYFTGSVWLFRRNIVLESAPVFFCLPIQLAVLNLLRKFLDLKKRNQELAKRVRELSIVNEVSQAVNFMGDLGKTLDTILSRAVQALGAERGSILLLDERYESLVEESVVFGVEGTVQFDPEKKTSFRTGEGVAGEVFTTGTSRLIHDVARQAEFKNFDGTAGIRSLLCVPLQVRDTSIGVMNVVNKTEGRFDQEDLQLALTMANQAAVVIEKARLFNLATIDGLTGLVVHRHFQAKMEEEFRRAKRYDKPLSFIMTDIDHFKKFNDTWGHQTGDMVLREVAKCVRSSIRDTDVAARYGGEEFAVILPETDAEGAVLFAERLRQKVDKARFKGPEGELQVTISLGVSAHPLNPMETTVEMIGLADEALYKAKHGGRNQVKLSDVLVPKTEEPGTN
jgi:diguanylate cyclase (GGDEF)-like protein